MTKGVGHFSPHSWCGLTCSHRWLHRLFLAVDANFRLKLKNRNINDPEIGSGWAYFVECNHYINHVSQNTTDMEVSQPPHGTLCR